MIDRSVRLERSRRVRRRRRVAVGSIAFACALIAFLLFANSRDAITNPKNLVVNNHGVKHRRFVIQSKAVGKPLPVEVLLPPDFDASDKRGIVLFLHGRGSKPDKLSSKVAMQSLAKAGPKAPILVFPYGGEASYWHNRADGDWDRYVTHEVLSKVVADYGGDRKRVAIAGISMGGYGAFNLARLHPGKFCVIAGHSPALWQSGGETAAGAFDDAGDFARNDVISAARTNPSAFSGAQIWLDAGNGDPFQPGDQAMISALRRGGIKVTAQNWAGGHEAGYWKAHYGAYVKFYTRALARCR
jgi:S-formylglutathione hydrolase FrmB